MILANICSWQWKCEGNSKFQDSNYNNENIDYNLSVETLNCRYIFVIGYWILIGKIIDYDEHQFKSKELKIF